MNTEYRDDTLSELGPRERSTAQYYVNDGYFEELEHRIMQQIPEHPPMQNVSWWIRLKPIVYLAASFAGIYYSFRIAHTLSSELKTNEQVGHSRTVEVELQDREYEEYYQDYLETIIVQDLEHDLGGVEYNTL